MNITLPEEVLELQSAKYIENYQLPAPDLLNYYREEKDRIIWVDYEIDNQLLEAVRLINYWNREDKDLPVDQRKKIKVLVFSYGGALDACFAFLDTCALSKTPIVTINMGIALSAGLLILLAGHERYCTPLSQALIHSGSGGTGGTYEQTEAQMHNYRTLVTMMKDYILSRTKIEPKLFAKKRASEWYLFAQQQVELGIVDGLATPEVLFG